MKVRAEITEKQPDSERAFMVRFVEAPEMPGPRWSGSDPLAVVACRPPHVSEEKGKIDGWSWVALDADEKDVVGNALLLLGGPHRWVWCLLFPIDE